MSVQLVPFKVKLLEWEQLSEKVKKDWQSHRLYDDDMGWRGEDRYKKYLELHLGEWTVVGIEDNRLLCFQPNRVVEWINKNWCGVIGI
jgi:hypothetical protein